MSREDIVAVATRLFALFLFVMMLRVVAQGVSVASMESGTGTVVAHAVVAFVMLCLAALLWFFPLSIARKLLPVMKEPRPERTASADTLFSLAVILMGLWLLANAIIDTVYWASLIGAMRQQAVPLEHLPPETRAGIIATGFEMVVAVLMLLGSSRIRALVQGLRHARTGTASADGARDAAPRADDGP